MEEVWREAVHLYAVSFATSRIILGEATGPEVGNVVGITLDAKGATVGVTVGKTVGLYWI